MLTGTPASAASARTTGKDAPQLFVGVDRVGAGPGRLAADVEHAAPAAASARPCAIAASGSRKRPPSEKESGVTFTTPMTARRGKIGEGGRVTGAD